MNLCATHRALKDDYKKANFTKPKTPRAKAAVFESFARSYINIFINVLLKAYPCSKNHGIEYGKDSRALNRKFLEK